MSLLQKQDKEEKLKELEELRKLAESNPQKFEVVSGLKLTYGNRND